MMMLWALGAPRATLVLLMCGALGAFMGMALNHFWLELPANVALLVFAGGVLLIYSWLGLGVLALGMRLRRGTARCAPTAGYAHYGRVEVVAAWALGLGLAWGVYVPALSVWKLVGFWWGFIRWLGA
jgi:hypothetical protein